MKISQQKVYDILKESGTWMRNAEIAKLYYPDTREAQNNTISRILSELINMGLAKSRPIKGVSYYEYSLLSEAHTSDLREVKKRGGKVSQKYIPYVLPTPSCGDCITYYRLSEHSKGNKCEHIKNGRCDIK